MNQVFLALGSNLGDSFDNLDRALKAINSRIGLVQNSSSIYETAAWGIEDQPDFLNMVVEITTKLEAFEVMSQIISIEKDLGRIRYEKWGMRKIDIDILFYNDSIISLENLSIPHPYLQKRKFVLEPLNEIAPLLIHPILKKSIRKLLELCSDELDVKVTKTNTIELKL